ncbi:unnamed protein product [Ectocarpus sp. 6 AP-2014]
MAAPGSMNNTLAKKLRWARTDLGYSPLHIASEDGRTEDVVNLLVSSEGKGTDDFQGGGKTALMLAAREGHAHVARELLNHGADINKKSVKCEKTALHFAAGCGQDEVAVLLVRRGADVETRDSTFRSALLLSAKAGADVSAEDQERKSSLSYATSLSSVDIALLLLRYGADVNASGGYDSSSVLHDAIQNRDNIEAMVDLLLRWGADETVVDNKGKTPLDVCTAETKDRVRKLLVNAPADRTWRRRGWLVMLCERERRKTEKKGCKVARTEEGIVLGGMAAWLLAVTDEGVLRTVVGFL